MDIDLRSSKNTNIKQSAYLQYLKSFSLNTIDTLKKLQRQFKDDISQNLLFQANSMFKRIRTLLNSYEVMVLEINDSFQFIQVPQFGCCMLKLFLQMMSIIKWSLKSIIARPAVYQQGQTNNNNINSSQTHKKSLFRATSQGSKKQISENQKFKLKEQSKYIMKGLDFDIKGFEQKNHNFAAQQSLINNILSDKQRILKIQASQSQNILQQAVKNLSKKGQNIAEFIQMRQKYMKYCKQNAGNYTMDAFQKLKQITQHQTVQRSLKIKQRLNQLVTHCIKIHDQSRKQSMVSKCYQIHIKDTNTSHIRQQTKYIDRLKENILSLQEQLIYQKQMNLNLTQLLKKKNDTYQNQLLQFRSDNLSIKNKSNLSNGKENYYGNSNTINKFNQGKQQLPKRKQSPQKKLTKFNDSGEIQHQQSNGLYKRKFNKNRSKKSTKYIRSKKIIQEGFQHSQQIQDNDQCQNFFDRIVSLKSIKSCYQRLQSKVITFDHYPTPERFKELIQPGMLTSVCFDQIYKTKGIQTDKVRILQFHKNLTLQQTTSINYKPLKTSPLRNQSILNDNQVLLKFSKPQTHRQSAIKRIAMNLTTRSSKIKQISQIKQIQKKQISQQQTAISSKRGVYSAITNSKFKPFESPLQTKNILNQNLKPYIISQDIKKIKVICQLKENIYFNKIDLLNLFLTQENAKNYQYLNYSFNPNKQKNYKSQSKRYFQSQKLQINCQDDFVNSQAFNLKQKSKRYHQEVDNLVFYFLKQIKKYQKSQKQNKNISIAIRSFLRYPYSYIKKCKQIQWQRYEKQEQDMQNWQLKRYIYRILNLHSKCFEKKNQNNQIICDHIVKFYEKIGIKKL